MSCHNPSKAFPFFFLTQIRLSKSFHLKLNTHYPMKLLSSIWEARKAESLAGGEADTATLRIMLQKSISK